MSAQQLAIAAMQAGRVSLGKDGTREDVAAALTLLDGAKAWIASRWPQFVEPGR